MNLDFVEQPVPAGSLDDLASVTRRVDTRVLADESVWTLRDLTVLVQRRAADLVNVKLAKTGGITEALRLMPTTCSSTSRPGAGSGTPASVAAPGGQ